MVSQKKKEEVEDRLFRELAAATPDLTESICQACEERIEFYRVWHEIGEGNRLRKAIRVILDHFASSRGSTELATDLDGVGALRATQGLPLEAIPTAWLIISDHVWQWIVGSTFDESGGDLSALWTRFLRYVNESAGAIQSSYVRVRSEAYAAEFMVARATLDALINTAAVEVATEEGLARAGHPGSRMRLLLCEHPGPGVDLIADIPGQFRALISALAGLSGRRVMPWTVWDGVTVIVLPEAIWSPGQIASLVARNFPELRAVLSRRSPTHCLIRTLLLQTRPLLALADDDHPFIDVERISLLNIVAAKLSIDFDEMPSWLQRFFEGDEKHNRKWSETVQALVSTNMNVTETAHMLYVHQNTIYYRLETINKYCGRDIRDPVSLADLQAAMQFRS